jgi:hypothetical protein
MTCSLTLAVAILSDRSMIKGHPRQKRGAREKKVTIGTFGQLLD